MSIEDIMREGENHARTPTQPPTLHYKNSTKQYKEDMNSIDSM